MNGWDRDWAAWDRGFFRVDEIEEEDEESRASRPHWA